MNAPARIPTEAEQAFAAQFDEARARLDGQASSFRQAAFDSFLRAGLPNRRVEAWHYTDLRARLKQAPQLAPKPVAADLVAAKAKLSSIVAVDAVRLVFVDGFFVAELSDAHNLAAGLTVRPLGEADAQLAQLAQLAGDPLVDLNRALHGQGVRIDIGPGGGKEVRLHLVWLSGAQGDRSRFSRNLMVVNEGARAKLIETKAEGGLGFGDHFLGVVLKDGAELDHVFRGLGGAPVLVETLAAQLGAGAKWRNTAFVAHAPFLRRQMFVSCVGEGAEARLSGASLLTGRDHADTTLVVGHDAPHGLSRETFKHILADEAQGVFQGKIVVAPHAQKTDGKMMCRALLLSDGAAMSAKPELEIFADDVACGHGASCGRLDEAQIFYFGARGVPRQQARTMLIEAFAVEALETIEDESLRELLRADLAASLAERVLA